MTTTLRARSPEDLLAAVPVVLGFRPSDSLVMLTFGAARAFHARVDLPPPAALDDDLPDLTGALLTPCLAHGVDQVVLACFTPDPVLAARVTSHLRPAFGRAGVGVLASLRAHDGRWTEVPRRLGRREPPMRAYDDRSHPFAATAVFDGRVTHGSREDLRGTVAADREACARIASLQQGWAEPGPEEVGRLLDLLGRCVAAGCEPDDCEAARALWAVRRVEARDAALYAVTRSTTRDHLRIWSGLLRRAPACSVPDAASVAAFCAWQDGDGALAWCALDRCFEVDPDHLLGRCLAECLTRAVPPTAWEEVGPRSDADSA